MDQRLRIGISIDAVHRVGGTQRSTWEIAERLGKEHDVVLLTKVSSATGEEPFRCHIVRGGVNIPYFGNLIFAWKVSRLKKKLRLDVLNVQGSNGLWQDVVTAHSVHKKWFLWSLGTTPRFTRPWWKKIFNPIHYVVMALETIQYKKAMHRMVIALSDQVKRDLINYFAIDASRIAVVHHGVNTTEFHPETLQPERLALRAKLDLSESDVVVIFVAHEFRRKGLSVLLQAMQRGDARLKLVVVGKDDPAPFKKQAEDLGLTPRVHFAGSQRHLAAWYAASDVFAFPTSYEAFGLVITEAMAAGLPVIVPRDAGAAELMKHGQEGYLLDRWDDIEQLTSYLNAICDKNERKQMAAAARRCAEARTWDDAARETLAIYRKVLTASGAKSTIQ